MKKHIDIILCLNRRHFTGAMAVIHSIIANTRHPPQVSFHFTVPVGESEELQTLVRRCFANPIFEYEIQEFQPSTFLAEHIRAGQHLTYSTYGSQVMNFSRFYLADLYPNLDKFIYLDADLVVQSDIAELWQMATLEKHLLAAVPFATFRSWEGGFSESAPSLQHVNFEAPVFNSGVYVTSLKTWRERGIQKKLEGWMKTHRQAFDDFVFGTQSVMNIAFYNDWQELPEEWNLVPLGLDETVPEATLRGAKILHWAGDRKPWTANGLYKEYWQKYSFGI